MVLPYAVCLPVWLVSYRVDTCHGATVPQCQDGAIVVPKETTAVEQCGDSEGGTEAWKTVSICKLVVVAAAAYKRLGVVSAGGLSFLAPEPNATRVCVGFVLNLNLTKCKILCTLKTD